METITTEIIKINDSRSIKVNYIPTTAEEDLILENDCIDENEEEELFIDMDRLYDEMRDERDIEQYEKMSNTEKEILQL